MKLVLDLINGALQDNLQIIVGLMIVVGAMILINNILGAILGGMESGFDLKKFLFGFLKGIVIALCIYAFGFVLNMFVEILSLVEIQIATETVTTLEVLGVLIAWGVDMSKDILEKIKSLKTMKYITYDDVKVVDYNVGSKG